MTTPIERILNGEVVPGVYRMDMSERPGSICLKVEETGWSCAYLDGNKIVNKEALLVQAADALSFPDYYGYNLDAFEECITEVGLYSGHGLVLLYDHAAVLYAQHADDWATFYDIVSAAVKLWAEHSRPFYVVLRNAGNIPQKAPPL